METQESPWKSPVFDFLITPVMLLIVALIHIVVFFQPTGYATMFSHGPMTDEELEDWEAFEDEEDWDE